MNAITFRLAKPDDLDDIVELSKGIYEGHDYLPLKFHKWLQLNNMAVILAHSGDKLIGLLACFIVDDGRTLVRRAERIRQELRGQGLVKQLREYARNHAKQHFPNLQRVRLTTVFDIVNSQHHTKLLDWDIVGYQVEKKFCSRALASTANSVEIKPCSREYFSNIILSSPVRRKLFQDDVILVNWCPFEPLRSNIDHMLQDRNEFFTEKCADGEIGPSDGGVGAR